MIVQWTLRLWLVVVATVLCRTTLVAQESVRFSEKPVAVQFSRGLSIYDQAAYFAALHRRLRVGRVVLRDVVHRSIDRPSPESQVPVCGTLIYLISGEETIRGTVSFELVRDREHAELRLEEHRKRMATSARIERSDAQTRIVRSWVTDRRLREDETLPELADSYKPGETKQRVLVQKNGSRFIRTTTSIFSHYRYEEGILFESAYRELYAQRLPSVEEINVMVASAGDAGIVYMPRQIGLADRTRMRNWLESVYGTILQRRQNEDPGTWRIRWSAGSWWLSLRKAIVDEVELCSITGFLAKESSPFRGEVRLRLRQNSDLQRDAALIASKRSRFAPVVIHPAVLTIHICTGLPDHAKALIRAVASELSLKANLRYSQPKTRDAARSLVDVIARFGERSIVDGFIQFTRFDEIGPVIYGAVRTDVGGWLIDALYTVLNSEIGSLEGWYVERTERNDTRFLHVIRLQLPDAPDVISDFWVGFDDGCLWFSAGRENAHEAIGIAVEECRNNSSSGKSPIVTVRLDIRRWLSWSKEDSSRLALLPQWLDEHDPTVALQSLFGSLEEPRVVTPLIARAFDGREGDGLKLTAGMEEGDLLIRLDVEPALIDYCFGRYLDLMEVGAREAEDYRRSVEDVIQRRTLKTLEMLDRAAEDR